jgi:hypothetical protein
MKITKKQMDKIEEAYNAFINAIPDDAPDSLFDDAFKVLNTIRKDYERGCKSSQFTSTELLYFT